MGTTNAARLDPVLTDLLERLQNDIVSTTRSVLGLDVFGSLATGDFEAGVSDVDLIAVLTEVPDARSSLVCARYTRRSRGPSPSRIETAGRHTYSLLPPRSGV